MSGLAVIVAGSRDWPDRRQVHARLDAALQRSGGDLVVVWEPASRRLATAVSSWVRTAPAGAIQARRVAAREFVDVATGLDRRGRTVELVVFSLPGDQHDELAEIWHRATAVVRAPSSGTKDFRPPKKRRRAESRIRRRDGVCVRCGHPANGCICN